jgi:hypothetical protein
VVDRGNLLLTEHLVDRGLELPARLKVGSERLLDDHAGALGRAGIARRADDATRGGRHGQPLESTGLPDRQLCSRDAGGQQAARG